MKSDTTAEPVEAWTPAPDEWVIKASSGNGFVTQYSELYHEVARYVQPDGSLTDLRGGWDAIITRTEVLG